MSDNSWQIEFHRDAQKSLSNIRNKDLVQALAQKIDQIKANPLHEGCRKLKGSLSAYRVRVRGWRIVYSLQNDERVILITAIEQRKDAYRKF